MLKFKKIVVSLVLILFMLILAVGGFLIVRGRSGGQTKLPKKLVKQIEVETLQTKEGENGLLLEAEVTIRDYSEIFAACYEEAQAESKNIKQFEKELYKMSAKASKKSKETIIRNVTVELSELDAEQEERAEKDMEEEARQKALKDEIEEFCLRLLAGEVPQEIYREVTQE